MTWPKNPKSATIVHLNRANLPFCVPWGTFNALFTIFPKQEIHAQNNSRNLDKGPTGFRQFYLPRRFFIIVVLNPWREKRGMGLSTMHSRICPPGSHWQNEHLPLTMDEEMHASLNFMQQCRGVFYHMRSCEFIPFHPVLKKRNRHCQHVTIDHVNCLGRYHNDG